MRKKTTNTIPNGDLGGLRGDACPPYPKAIKKKCVWKCEMKEGPRAEERDLQVCKRGERNRDPRAGMPELHEAKMSARSG